MSNFIGGYPQITEVGGDDLLPVIQDGELKNVKSKDLTPLQMKIGLSQTGTSNPTVTTFFNNTGETLEFIRFSEGYYYTILPESMYDLFIENLYTKEPFATTGSTNIVVNGRFITFFLELDSGDRLLSINCFQSDGTTPEELVDIITSTGILFLPTIYIK
jgi:hypothetical protein